MTIGPTKLNITSVVNTWPSHEMDLVLSLDSEYKTGKRAVF